MAEVKNQGRNPDANVITFDGRFIAYDNGTVKDTRTGLMWAAKDGGKAIEEADLKTYFNNYRAGGYDDWRIPTIAELEEIYDEGTENKHGYHLTELIDLAGEWVWGLDGRDLAISFGFIEGSPAIAFFDGPGSGAWYQTKKTGGGGSRPLPVRATEKFQTEKQETGDGRFIAHYNGTVSDKKTGLMWAAGDDGKGINKRDLSAYFNNYRAGGYDDWRIPTVDELKTIYGPAGKKHISCVTDLIHVSDEWVWALGDREFILGYSFFHGGSEGYAGESNPRNHERLDYLLVCRVLPVRGGR
jgi:predicted heme/steroid binding protein